MHDLDCTLTCLKRMPSPPCSLVSTPNCKLQECKSTTSSECDVKVTAYSIRVYVLGVSAGVFFWLGSSVLKAEVISINGCPSQFKHLDSCTAPVSSYF